MASEKHNKIKELLANLADRAGYEPAVVIRRAQGRRRPAQSADRRAGARARACDAIMLANFSTSRALEAVIAAVGTTVLTAPDAAVDRIRAAIKG